MPRRQLNATALRFQPTYGRIWGVTYPLIIAGISEAVVDITDTVFLAHYGVTELAAIGLAGAIYSVALFMTLGLVDGTQILIGRRAGEGTAGGIGPVFNQGLYLLGLAAVVLTLLVKFALPPLTARLFASADVHGAVDAYLQISVYGLLFHSFNLAISTFYIGIARTRVLIGATLVLAVTNIALDYALIFGNWGLPELGIVGAAYASLAAETATFTFLLVHVLIQRFPRTYGLLRFSRWDRQLARRLMSLSTPVSLETLVETLRWFIFFAIIERLGEDVLARANILFSCYALFLIPVDAFSETICSMVSNLIGQARAARLAPLLRRTIMLTYIVVAPLLVLTLLFPDEVVAIFSTQADIIEGTVGALIVVVLVILIAVPAEMGYSALAGAGDTRAMLQVQLIVSACTLAYAYWAALVQGLPLSAIWLAEAVGWGVCILLSWLWLRRGRWKALEL